MFEGKIKNKKAEGECKKWQRLGAIVVDTQTLLEHLARISDKDLTPYVQKHFNLVRSCSMLLASEALADVLTTLNDEYYHNFIRQGDVDDPADLAAAEAREADAAIAAATAATAGKR